MKLQMNLLNKLFLAGFILLNVHAVAQPAVGTRIPVTVTVEESPASQIRRSEQLRESIDQLPEGPERVQRVLQVLANLDVVHKAWPKAIDAIVDASVLQSEIALEFNMPRNAADSLAAALPGAKGTRHEARLAYKLGSAYEAAGMMTEAEKHYVLAEASPHFKHLGRFDATDALQTMAMFYMRQNKPRESMSRFRAAAEVPNQSGNTKALYRLSALKEALRLKDDNDRSEAKREAKALRDAVHDARLASKAASRGAELQILAGIERDMHRVLSDAGL